MELTFSSGSVTDILGKLLKDSNSENNNDTQHDDNHSNKLKDPIKYPLSFKHSFNDFFVRWVTSYIERALAVTTLFETWLKNNKYISGYVTKPGYSFIYWFTLNWKNAK